MKQKNHKIKHTNMHILYKYTYLIFGIRKRSRRRHLHFNMVKNNGVYHRLSSIHFEFFYWKQNFAKYKK
jgi:hypothetical protein